MGCVQSKPSKRQGLFKQQEEIISQGKQEEEIINKQQGNNNKDDSEKVRRSDGHPLIVDGVNSSISFLFCCC